MSQILRVAGRLTVSPIRSIESLTICESCISLRNGLREYSTQTKREQHLKFFKKRRWKKKKEQLSEREEYQELVRITDTRFQDLRKLGNTRNAVREGGLQFQTQIGFQGENKIHQNNVIKETNQLINYKHSKNPVLHETKDLNFCETLDGNSGRKNTPQQTVVKNENNIRQQEEFDIDGDRHFSDISDKKTVISKNFQKQNHETELTKIRKVQKSSKMKGKKAMMHEVYGRKSKKIHDKQEKIKNKEKFIETRRTLRLLHELHDPSKSLSDLNVTEFDEGLEHAKRMFSYKSKDTWEPLSSEFVFEGSVDKDLAEMEESVSQDGDVEESVSDIEEGHSAGKSEGYKAERFPDAEWNVLKTIRKRKKKTDFDGLTVEEMGKLEMKQDVFHEDVTIQQDFQTYRPIDETSIKKVQKKRKEKDRKNKWERVPVDEKMILDTKVEIFNQDLLSYVHACMSCGITNRAIEDIKMYRTKNSPENKVTDVRIYNMVLRGLGREDQESKRVREVFKYIREDGLQPDMETYMLCLSCLGKASGYDLVLASHIVKDMEKEGLDVKDIFNKCTFLYNERSRVYQTLTKVVPDFEPNPTVIDVKYEGPLVEPLNEMLSEEEKVEMNPFTCGMTKEEIMKAAEEQFGRELDGIVTINSIFKNDSDTDKWKREEMDKLLKQWRANIKEAFIRRKCSLRVKTYLTQGINMYPFFCLFPDDDYVDILCEELRTWSLTSQMFSPSCALLRKFITLRIRMRFSIQQMIEMDAFPKLHKAYSKYVTHLTDPSNSIPKQRELWKKIIQDLTDGNSMERPWVEWAESVRYSIGDILFDLMLENAKIDQNLLSKSKKPEKLTSAFIVVERSRDGRRNLELRPNPILATLVDAEADLIMPTDKIPSLCPPVPFIAPGQGGNFISTADLIRWCMVQQTQILTDKADEMSHVLDSLNILSTYAWKINKPVLDVAVKVFKQGGNRDLEIPILPESIQKPKRPDPSAPIESVKEYNKELFEYTKGVREAVSLWWSDLYKLSIANELRDRTFWLSMNIDFRGRAYPVAPHLHHQSQDHVKAFMMFAKGKPLGKKGFDWLKIHLVNLTEHKKRSPIEERLQYADEMIPEILDSADKPLTGRKWWMTSESPWQTLAACMEVAAASRSSDPCKFVSHFPVHQDGSCNGLQHYAALGRDTAGARSVNLKQEGDIPADLYSDVVDLVKKEIEYDIKYKTSDYKIATLCQPYLDRKCIKQSIMTTVYGVTMYGAKLQIQRQLGYKEFPEEFILVGSRYLAEKTFKCLNNLFSSARQIQAWFERCANVIGKSGQAVEWETPLNLFCIQPYYKNQEQPVDMPDKIYHYLIFVAHTLRTANTVKQKNGFPPNFIHSLDSAHMMLTALYCYRKGLTYASVHDSYWTHACDIDEMSKITREQFIALHNQPILPALSHYFIDRYIHSEDITDEQREIFYDVFTKFPEKGDFDLNEVLKSPYFFS